VFITGTPVLMPVSFNLSPTFVSLSAGQSQQFTASVAGTYDTRVNWSVYPQLGTLSSTGLYTAPASVSSPQVLTLWAASVADPTKYATAQISLTASVSPSQVAGISITATPTSVTPGGLINLSWTAPADRPLNDWVALYPVGSSGYIWWSYIGATSRSILVTAPAQPGLYEFLYIPQGGLPAARTSPISVGGSAVYSVTPSRLAVSPGAAFTVGWTAPAGRPANDWVALYPVGGSDLSFVSWQYTGGAMSGFATLTAPQQTGQYEVRYLLENNYQVAARTSPISVTGFSQFSLTPDRTRVQRGGNITISWTSPPERSGASDWIVLVPIDGSVWNWWRYTGVASGTAQLTAPSQPGSYEFRYYLDNSTNEATRSDVITVE
jgi:hypothetical protein